MEAYDHNEERTASLLAALIQRNVIKKIVHYLKRVRVETAKNLLETSSLSFFDITFQVGYEDCSSFRRVFIKTVNQAPGVKVRLTSIALIGAGLPKK